MIRPDNRFDDYAYRVGEFPLSKDLTKRDTLEDGVMVTLNENAELVIADGADIGAEGKPGKAYVCTTSNVGGRNQVSGKPFAQGTILIGPACLWIDTVRLMDKNAAKPLTYAPGMPLYIAVTDEEKFKGEAGYLTKEAPYEGAPVVGYAMSSLVAEAGSEENHADGYVKQDGRNYRAFLRVQFVA